jgi:hypothetical protein
MSDNPIRRGNLATTAQAAARKKSLGQIVGKQIRGFGFKPVKSSEDGPPSAQMSERQKKKLIPNAPIPGEREADLDRIRAIRKRKFATKRSGSEKGRKHARFRERAQSPDGLYLEAARIKAEQRALRRIVITREDELALGSKSSGWGQFKETLRSKLVFLKRANLGRADEAASALNRMGFKTGSGQLWTPRLINVAKMKLFDNSGRTPAQVSRAGNLGPGV